MAQIELSHLVNLAQSYIARNYAAALVDKSKTAELKAYIGKYLLDTGYSVPGYDTKGLIDRLYSEMAEYSILTRYLTDPDIEEININGWDDIALTHLFTYIIILNFRRIYHRFLNIRHPIAGSCD